MESENQIDINISNVEALAFEFPSWPPKNEYQSCCVGYTNYVIAAASFWCGSCNYEYVNPTGDGRCILQTEF
jgi:hypothetical protein